MQKACKSSCILHSVLRVTHQLIASIVFQSFERSTVNSIVLRLFYCMNHDMPIKPQLGAHIFHKLLKVSQANFGHIQCGGLVNLIAHSNMLGLNF